jgi:formylglycine-generating enzyme required for sulfatase activity
MAGNVQEWTSSLFIPLPDELFPPGKLYVSRGGSFYDTAYGARTSYRRAYPPGYFFSFLGFRVVVENR